MIIVVGSFLGFFVCLSVHEATHSLISYKLGDPTSKTEGRLSLNPLRHIDPVGTVAVPLFLILSGLPAFGWAKPVMVNIGNFKNPQRDNFLTAIAGPISNILFALLIAFALRFMGTESILGAILVFMVQINIVLAVFNLLPIPPLDGSKVWHLILSDENYYTLEQMGPFILIAVLIFSYSTGGFVINIVRYLTEIILRLIT